MIAELHIQATLRNNKTCLKKAYYTTPFKIADVTENKAGKALKLMLMSSSPGVLDGDKYNIRIEVADSCLLELQTQSYQRLFSMKKGASQKMDVRMEKNSSFCFLPHPAVPHKDSDFVSKNRVCLQPGCTLIWGEVLTCGRKLSGEQFAFSKYHSLTEVYLNDRLMIKENLLVQPAFINVNSIGQLEGYTHQASLLYINETARVSALITELHALLMPYDICFGVSALPVNGVTVRMLGHKGEQLYNLQKLIAEYVTKSAKIATC